MDQRIFKQIDDLERSAREIFPVHGRIRPSADSFDRYDAFNDTFDEQASNEWAIGDNDFDTRPRHPPHHDLSQFAYSSSSPSISAQPLDGRTRNGPHATTARRPTSQNYEQEDRPNYARREHMRRSQLADETRFEANTAGEYRDDTREHRPGRVQKEDTAISVHRSYDSRVYGPSFAPPIVQGIPLVPTRELPDRFRAIFPFPILNAIQSKSFDTIYRRDDNFVLSAPTGSGKTAILELAICRVMNKFVNGNFKIVYQAPTKSLCAERQRDWQSKFGPLDLQVAELTGDTESTQLRNVQHASIIVTTPEKWDSVTRKWKDHKKLMQMVRLFLIDEVHILKEDRGATLEAVVSRMKTMGTDVRFVALSATVPNSQDVATWLGKDFSHPKVPAALERFGEEFRPVPLQKHVCGYKSALNDFAFQNPLNKHLTEVIAKWSEGKPLMVFCFTRNACVDTAKFLANWSQGMASRDRLWQVPTKPCALDSKDLRGTCRLTVVRTWLTTIRDGTSRCCIPSCWAEPAGSKHCREGLP
jgi:superfamily II RNA helicase